jgi:phenylpyruvate tautomerase PptA (4-oxalocrotonate tautomerase family)
MPLQLIHTEGLLSEAAKQKAFDAMTKLLLELHGLKANRFMTPAVVGEVIAVPVGRTFSGGNPSSIAVIELKVPSFVLGTKELKEAWIEGVTNIVENAAEGRLKRSSIFANVTYAVDGTWGIGGVAYSNEALAAAIQAAAN